MCIYYVDLICTSTMYIDHVYQLCISKMHLYYVYLLCKSTMYIYYVDLLCIFTMYISYVHLLFPFSYLHLLCTSPMGNIFPAVGKDEWNGGQIIGNRHLEDPKGVNNKKSACSCSKVCEHCGFLLSVLLVPEFAGSLIICLPWVHTFA